jgi:tRNA(fMet)-specific endonuclease VapC
VTDEVLLDTDILSSVMRRDPRSFPHAEAYLRRHRAFTFSIITRYEILRGLKAKSAQVQLVAFERLCASSRVLPVSEQVVAAASDLYASLYRSGEIIGDADILIAATALTHNLPLATNNLQHFNRVPGLQLQSWLRPA